MDEVKYAVFWVAVALILSSPFLYMAYRSISASGQIEYCYVEMWSPHNYVSPQFQSVGFREWRTDRSLGVYPTAEEAKRQSDILGCKIEVKP